MNFDFYNPTRLITGSGCVAANSAFIAALGKKCMIITSGPAAKLSGALDDVLAVLAQQGIGYVMYDKVQPNPLLTSAKESADIARAEGVEFMLAIGGGSAMDAGKATAVLATNDLSYTDFYDLTKWVNAPLPIIAIGTTAGTGSEVGPTAVLTTPEGQKKSVIDARLYPAIAFGDARYTASMPLAGTISTALDALAHSVEGYFALSATEISDMFATEAVSILYGELSQLKGLTSADNITFASREAFYYASVLAGFTLARCGTCYCHALGYYLSEEHDVPHGMACSVFIPGFLRRAAQLMPQRAAQFEKRVGCTIPDLCALVEALCDYSHLRFTPEVIEALVTRSTPTGNFTRTAPAGYTGDEARAELNRIFGQ